MNRLEKIRARVKKGESPDDPNSYSECLLGSNQTDVLDHAPKDLRYLLNHIDALERENLELKSRGGDEQTEFLVKLCWAAELITGSRAKEILGITLLEVRGWDREKILEE